MKSLPNNLHKGFTLIELLVVIAVLGVLAVVLLVAIDPIEKINQASDAGVKTNVGQVANAVTAFGVNHDSVYPELAGGAVCAPSVTWGSCLTTAGELKTNVPGIDPGATSINYAANASPATSFNVRAPFKSKTERSKATTATGNVGCATATNITAWQVYVSSTGSTIYICTTGPAVTPAYQ